MENENLCFYAKKIEKNVVDDIVLLNFVYEVNTNSVYNNYVIRNSYFFCVVTEGKGIYETIYKKREITRGDFFIVYPSTSYKIVSIENLKYIFISFIGNKYLTFADKLIVSKDNPIVHEQFDLVEMYKQTIKKANGKNTIALGLGLFYLTIANLYKTEDSLAKVESKIANTLRQKIESNYSNSSFSLGSVANELGYHPNYLSWVFKKEFGINFSVFLQNTRLASATNLINGGFTSIKEISNLVGFSDSLYFSKAFKKAYTKSPSEMIQSVNSKLYKTDK